MKPQVGDAPDCVHGSCPAFYIDDMFNERVRCGCPCHRLDGPLLVRILARLARAVRR